LAARLFIAPEPAKIVVFVSCKPHEGVSHTVRALHDFLGSRMTLRSMILSAEDWLAIAQGKGQNVSAGASNRPGRSSSYSVQSSPIEEQFTTLRGEHDAVLVDGGALDVSSRVLQLAAYVDGFVLVVEAGLRGKLEIRRAAEAIEAAQGRLLGVVLNKRRYPIPSWLYRFLQ
jgi:hypothetical protein